MTDLETFSKQNKESNKFKALVLAATITISSIFGLNKALAQGNLSRDQILDAIEQTLNQKWGIDYSKLLQQRNSLLNSNYNGSDIVEKFVNTQKRDFELSYKNNEYWIKNSINTLRIILQNDFDENLNWKTPVQIISAALKVISNEESMIGLRNYTNNLSGEFDKNFVDAYGYVQAFNKNTWINIWNTTMPSFELDWLVWIRTINDMIKILNEWNFSANYQDYIESSTNTKIETPTITVGETKSDTPSTPTPTITKSTTTTVSTPSNTATTINDNILTQSKQTWKTTSTTTNENTDKDLTEKDNDKKANSSDNWKMIYITIGNKNKVWANTVKVDTAWTPSEKKIEKEDIQQQKQTYSSTNTKSNSEDIFDNIKMPDNTIINIVENMNWNSDILSKYLHKENLNNISYEDIINTINWFKDDNLKKVVMKHLLENNIQDAQRIMWLDIDCDSRYPDYVAGTKLWKKELANMAKLWKYRMYYTPDEVLENSYIPQYVKLIYEEILDGKINTHGKPYSIVSKRDYRVYLFSSDHHLLSKQSVLVWSTIWDKKSDPKHGIQTTPSGAYEVWKKFDKYKWKDFFINYGSHYIVLIPLNNQYDLTDDFTMWIHGDFKADNSRKEKLKSSESKDHRTTNGCINVDSDTFGEIYNHMIEWSVLFVTSE